MAEEHAATPADGTKAPETATPATPGTSTPPAQEMVTIPKSELESMKARQSASDKEASRLRGAIQKGGHFQTQTPPGEGTAQPTPTRADGTAEDLKAERGILRLAAQPDYRAALDADPTFRDLILKNPLSVLPMYANDAYDAEDAIGLVEKELQRRAASIKDTNAHAKPTTDPVVPPTPAANPSPETNPDYQEKLKSGDIAGAIRLKKFGAGGKK